MKTKDQKRWRRIKKHFKTKNDLIYNLEKEKYIS